MSIELPQKTFSKFFNLTVSDCNKLSSTERQIAQTLAKEYPDKFRTKKVLDILLGKAPEKELKKSPPKKSMAKKMRSRSNRR